MMNNNYGRDLDLNLLRVFCIVADAGSVTHAASKLYLTQPAVSAALARLGRAVGAPLFVREGRKLSLTSRGKALRARAEPHLSALVHAALAPEAFDVKQSDRVLRLGLSDASESWLLPGLLQLLRHAAPRMRLVAVPVQFRTVGAALVSGGIDMAVTVADELAPAVRRRRLFWGDFVCLFDRRFARVGKRLTERQYFEREHVVVSYNADLRGIVEDLTRKSRSVRCSIGSFANIPAVVEGSDLLATVPRLFAKAAVRARPHLAHRELPFKLEGSYTELLWLRASDDDDACRFLRERIEEVAAGSKP